MNILFHPKRCIVFKSHQRRWSLEIQIQLVVHRITLILLKRDFVFMIDLIYLTQRLLNMRELGGSNIFDVLADHDQRLMNII